MKELKDHKHLIGSLVVMILAQMLLLPGGMVGTVISLAWIVAIVYAQIKGGVQFKRDPELKDYFMFHVEAVKFSAKNLFKG